MAQIAFRPATREKPVSSRKRTRRPQAAESIRAARGKKRKAWGEALASMRDAQQAERHLCRAEKIAESAAVRSSGIKCGH